MKVFCKSQQFKERAKNQQHFNAGFLQDFFKEENIYRQTTIEN